MYGLRFLILSQLYKQRYATLARASIFPFLRGDERNVTPSLAPDPHFFPRVLAMAKYSGVGESRTPGVSSRSVRVIRHSGRAWQPGEHLLPDCQVGQRSFVDGEGTPSGRWLGASCIEK